MKGAIFRPRARAILHPGMSCPESRPMRRLLPALLLALLLPGCAEVWVRPGTTEMEAEAFQAACRDESRLAVPPQVVTQIVSPARIERDRHCWTEGGQTRCRTTQRYIPAQWGQVDLNERPREGWRRQCMAAKGFTFEGYRPLRLE